MKQFRNKSVMKYGALYILAAIVFGSFPLAAFAAGPTVDVTANGQNSLTLAAPTDSFTVEIASTDATACQVTSPVLSGVSMNTSMSVAPGDAWYPTVGGSTTVTVSCTDGVTSSVDSVVISLPASAPAANPTVDIKANGSDGPVTINNGDSYVYTWTSANATACELTSPVLTGVSLSGTSVAVVPADVAWYPTIGSSVTLTISCTNGVVSATDSVVINLAGLAPAANPTVDIKANGSDGPVTINNGDSYTYTWTSANATACQITTPVVTGVTLSGTSVPVVPTDAGWYPTSSSSVTITITCTNGVTSAVDSVVVRLASGGGGSSNPTVDIKANGSDGPVTINNGDSYVYTWTSANATACQITTPVTTGVTLAGTSVPVLPADAPWYPAVGSSVTITITCTNGVTSAVDSVVINVRNPSNGGGGSGHHHGGGSTTPTPTPSSECPIFITSYITPGANNDPVQVAKLQAFLVVMEGNSNLAVTGVYDQATINAVKAFQAKYRDLILAPLGLSNPTGNVHAYTLAAINVIYCGNALPISPAPVQPPQVYHPAPHVDKESAGMSKEGCGKEGCAASNTFIPVVGESKGQNETTTTAQSLAASVFAGPASMFDLMQCAYEFLLILVVLYIIGSLLENVLYKNVSENVRKRFMTKWITFAVGTVVAILGAYLLKEWCLVLPLMVALIMSLIWLFLYPKHNSMRASGKSWYLVTSARAKSIWRKNNPEVVIEKK